ncbi:MAG: Asp-tRNA(Asn)/Glu-tRNA(Gln) amidotransferase subunit GatC [Gemmatimonadetes bacterium]|nr:Asp-tRNA(Asn)/Glu-tRNA(Gln) amidotransferase subunit GatC [Gemmatimonadota bacterium]
MSVTRRDVEYIAALARLQLTEAETEQMTSQLNSILEYMEMLGRLDVSGVEGVSGMAEWAAPAQAADALPDPLQRPLSALSPGWRDGFFVVPRLPAVEGLDPEDV